MHDGIVIPLKTSEWNEYPLNSASVSFDDDCWTETLNFSNFTQASTIVELFQVQGDGNNIFLNENIFEKGLYWLVNHNWMWNASIPTCRIIQTKYRYVDLLIYLHVFKFEKSDGTDFGKLFQRHSFE